MVYMMMKKEVKMKTQKMVDPHDANLGFKTGDMAYFVGRGIKNPTLVFIRSIHIGMLGPDAVVVKEDGSARLYSLYDLRPLFEEIEMPEVFKAVSNNSFEI
jgi:hypothetical protein